jgi:hypothetical protein
MLQLTTIFFLIAFSVLAVIHNIAMQLFLYWHIWWFDIPVHTLGGIVVALGFFALRDLRIFPNAWLKPVPVLALVLGVALLWELFELVAGIPNAGDYAIDTSIDVTVGVLGGFVGYIIGNSLRNLR